MLRALLVAALVVVASSHKHYNNYYGLGSLLQPAQINPSIQLVVGRYPGISHLAAAEIIRLSLTSPIESYISAINGFSSVPSIVSGRRLSYLQAYLSGFPGSPFYTSYTSPLVDYLGTMGISVGPAQLIDSLALTDYYTSSYRVLPVSAPLFNQFYYSYLLGQSGPVARYSFPQLSYFLPRLQSYSFPGTYFHSITPQLLTAPTVYSAPGSVYTGPGPAYTGPGSAFLPVYPALGLPYPVNPAATLSGLNSYLLGSEISFPSYVNTIRASQSIPSFVRSVSIGRYRSHLRPFGFLSDELITRDILPLIGSRYASFPTTVRSSFYMGDHHLDFNGLFGGYLGSSYFSGLRGRYSSYSPSFVSALLSEFDHYTTRGSFSRLTKYHGPWWRNRLYRKSHKYYKKCYKKLRRGRRCRGKKYHKG